MVNKGIGFLAGFVIGALTGAVVALLFAPESGEELRGEIEARGSELRDQGRIVISDNVRKAQQAVQDAQSRLSKAETDALAAGNVAA